MLVDREKAEFEKLGKEWLPADERNALMLKEQEEQAKEAYEAELKESCLKTGKNFEEALAEHNSAVEAKKAKEAEKRAIKEEKAAQKEKNKELKEKQRFEALSKEARDQLLAKQKEKEEKTKAFWEKEKAYGEEQYSHYRKVLAGK